MAKLNEIAAYTLAGAARYISVSKPTMSKLLPEIPHRRFGKRIIIPKSSLDRWLEGAK
jgi:excisionase family DNA binding protein